MMADTLADTLGIQAMSTFRLLMVLAISWGMLSSALAQEQFELTVPGRPELTSRATIHGAKLIVTDATGSSYTYDRHAAFDTADGELIGYRSLTAGTSLRWPVVGAGGMWIGDLAGTAWKRSQQTVNRVVGPVGVGLPGVPAIHGPGGVACLAGTAGSWAAHVGSDGKLCCFYGGAGKWKHRELPLTAPLIPGAPLALYSTSGTLPGLLTISPAGRMISIVDGMKVTPLVGTVTFPPGAHIEYLMIGPRGHAFSIDIQGRLWDIDIDTHTAQMVEPAVGAFPPGAPLAVLMDGTIPVVTAVNNASVMVAYGRTGSGWTPATVAAGFTPGTHIASTRLVIGTTPSIQVAAVNWAGQLQLWSKSTTGWVVSIIPTVLLSPGSPVEIGSAGFGPLLTAIAADGVWHAWTYDPITGWKDGSIGPGYIMGAPMALLPGEGTLFTVDGLGRLVIASPLATGWGVSFGIPSINYTPQLLSRRIVPNPALPPAQVGLVNSSKDDLIIQIVDQFQPKQPEELKIPAGGQMVKSLARDAGSTIEETYLVPGPLGTLIERTELHPVPPQQRYTLVAWSNKVTYQYIDNRRNRPKGAVPSFDLKTHVSLGVIPVPPGPLLEDGESLDVPMIAQQTNNPGAARYFPHPVSPPVTIETPPAK